MFQHHYIEGPECDGQPTLRRSGCGAAFTLLEVILALAILAGAVAMLGEAMSIASRSASDAQAIAQAQLLASSVMDEMLSGIVDLSDQSRQPLETDSAIPWVCSVTLGDTTLAGLMAIEVLVEQNLEPQFRPVKYRLLRWVATEAESPGESDSGSDSEGGGNA